MIIHRRRIMSLIFGCTQIFGISRRKGLSKLFALFITKADTRKSFIIHAIFLLSIVQLAVTICWNGEIYAEVKESLVFVNKKKPAGLLSRTWPDSRIATGNTLRFESITCLCITNRIIHFLSPPSLRCHDPACFDH